MDTDVIGLQKDSRLDTSGHHSLMHSVRKEEVQDYRTLVRHGEFVCDD